MIHLYSNTRIVILSSCMTVHTNHNLLHHIHDLTLSIYNKIIKLGQLGIMNVHSLNMNNCSCKLTLIQYLHPNWIKLTFLIFHPNPSICGFLLGCLSRQNHIQIQLSHGAWNYHIKFQTWFSLCNLSIQILLSTIFCVKFINSSLCW